MRAIATVGASGSGKSHWAREFIQRQSAAGEVWVELNKDDLRREILAMRGVEPAGFKQGLLDWNYEPAGADETEMKALLAARLSAALASGVAGVIFSNTNLDGGAQPKAQLAAAGADPESLEIQLFPMDFDECVRRDQNREFVVGPAVIASQFAKLHALGLGFAPAPSSPKPKM